MIEHPNGCEIQTEHFRIFFGGKGSDFEKLQSQFPDLKFLRLHQTHSDIYREVDSNSDPQELQGDALITCTPGLALCVKSADCVPILIGDSSSGWSAAIHAGWRGVANKIVPKTLQGLISRGLRLEHCHIWIGPHILMDSFQVQKDVHDQLIQSLPAQIPQNFGLYSMPDGDRYLVSLVQILIEQLKSFGLRNSQIELEIEDTKTSDQFHSARRDGNLSGRQLSWIARTR